MKDFPAQLFEDVAIVRQQLPREHTVRLQDMTAIGRHYYTVSLNGALLHIPRRCYTALYAPTLRSSLTLAQEAILDCIYSRHHNGFVRQESAGRLVNNFHDWAVPYAFQLLGEYVVQIMQVLDQHFTGGNLELYKRFIAENPRYWQKTQSRVVSYWDCYYRKQFPEIKNYIGYQIIQRLK